MILSRLQTAVVGDGHGIRHRKIPEHRFGQSCRMWQNGLVHGSGHKSNERKGERIAARMPTIRETHNDNGDGNGDGKRISSALTGRMAERCIYCTKDYANGLKDEKLVINTTQTTCIITQQSTSSHLKH